LSKVVCGIRSCRLVAIEWRDGVSGREGLLNVRFSLCCSDSITAGKKSSNVADEGVFIASKVGGMRGSGIGRALETLDSGAGGEGLLVETIEANEEALAFFTVAFRASSALGSLTNFLLENDFLLDGVDDVDCVPRVDGLDCGLLMCITFSAVVVVVVVVGLERMVVDVSIKESGGIIEEGEMAMDLRADFFFFDGPSAASFVELDVETTGTAFDELGIALSFAFSFAFF
jgi:hypothetical protein